RVGRIGLVAQGRERAAAAVAGKDEQVDCLDARALRRFDQWEGQFGRQGCKMGYLYRGRRLQLLAQTGANVNAVVLAAPEAPQDVDVHDAVGLTVAVLSRLLDE